MKKPYTLAVEIEGNTELYSISVFMNFMAIAIYNQFGSYRIRRRVIDDEIEFYAVVDNQQFAVAFEEKYSRVDTLFLELLIYKIHKELINEEV